MEGPSLAWFMGGDGCHWFVRGSYLNKDGYKCDNDTFYNNI